jgi:hypothetical protein
MISLRTGPESCARIPDVLVFRLPESRLPKRHLQHPQEADSLHRRRNEIKIPSFSKQKGKS